MVFTVLMVLAPSAFAAPQTILATVPPTCDAEFYDVLANRAWLESKREMEIAQTLIRRPDSVLEYSCFGAVLQANSSAAGSSPNGIDALAGGVLVNHLDKNFGHTLGGGTFTGAASGVCNAMAMIWEAQKCANFDKALFGTFRALYNNDPRALPLNCDANDRDRRPNMEAAFNTANPAPEETPVNGGAAKVLTHLDKITSQDRTGASRCSTAIAIPTGLGDEHSCSVPGCNYDGSSCK